MKWVYDLVEQFDNRINCAKDKEEELKKKAEAETLKAFGNDKLADKHTRHSLYFKGMVKAFEEARKALVSAKRE